MLNEKAKSKAQQKFMGLVHSVQKGETDPEDVSKNVKDAAKSMKKKDVKDFASTKHKGIPSKVKKEQKLRELVRNLVSKILVKEGYIKVPAGYEEKIKSIADMVKSRSDFYNKNGVNQLLIDLNYTIKGALRDYIHGNVDSISKAGFEKALSRELDSVLYKYTTGKFQLFDSSNKNKIKKSMIKTISDNIDVENVDLRDKSILHKIKDTAIEIINNLLK